MPRFCDVLWIKEYGHTNNKLWAYDGNAGTYGNPSENVDDSTDVTLFQQCSADVQSEQAQFREHISLTKPLLTLFGASMDVQ